MGNIPTAKDFYNKWVELTDKRILDTSIPRDNNIMEDLFIEFAKLHLDAQQKAILENFTMKPKDNIDELDMNDDFMEVDKDSIINAYPLENIV
jgi:hypothetical protein